MTTFTFYYSVLLYFGFDMVETVTFLSQALDAKVQWVKRGIVYHLKVTPK